MKKRLLFLFVIVMLFTLVSCNKQKEEVEVEEEVEAINWEAEYYELQANIVIETYEEYFEVIKENVLLKAEIEYLKEYIENIINYEVLKEEQYWTEQYLETFLTIFENANKELIKYGLYLGYDGKIYVKE